MKVARVPRGVRWALVPLATWVVYREVEIVGLGRPLGPAWYQNALYWAVLGVSVVLLMLRARSLRGRPRLAWALIAAGALAWSAGEVYWTLVLENAAQIPLPSPADAGYLAFYPLVFAGLCLLARERVRDAPATLWVDGVSAALAGGAVVAAVILPGVANAMGATALETATNLAYPVGDIVLLGVVVAATALGRWRMDRGWQLTAAGLVLFCIADCVYLATSGSYDAGNVADPGWGAGLVLLAAAAWRPRARVLWASGREIGVRTAIAPIAFAAAAVGVLAYSEWRPAGALVIPVLMAVCSLLAVLARLVMTLAENARMLQASRDEAQTDALTGLGNRRALLAEIERRLAAGGAFSLALFDLDGFKHYNDTFGHPAGDALLMRLGERLGAHVAGRGTAYRMGGDEFCTIVDGDDAGTEAAARVAFAEAGEGFSISASCGVAFVPAEAATASDALRTADRRMYASKHAGRAPAALQSRDVLLRVLAERHPALGDHLQDVAGLSTAVAAELGMEDEDIGAVRHAAELHDVGKIAIPDAILLKPGPLDEAEWDFMRTHTIIGERIILAAPDLAGVARLVRSSHERWDGGGYPDGLRGPSIPLGARIVAVCDAYDAMVTDRSYRKGMPAADALAELARCAGTQFDPEVVAAFSRVHAGSGARVAA